MYTRRTVHGVYSKVALSERAVYRQTHVPEFRQNFITKLGLYYCYQIRTLLLTKFGDMGLAVHGKYTQSWFAVHAVYCTRRVRVVYKVCTRAVQ